LRIIIYGMAVVIIKYNNGVCRVRRFIIKDLKICKKTIDDSRIRDMAIGNISLIRFKSIAS